MAVKTMTVRLPQMTYEKLCQLAESLEELPSETGRNILREFIANLGETAPGLSSPVLKRLMNKESPALRRLLNEPSELEVRLRTGGFNDLPLEQQNRLRLKYGVPQVVKGRIID